MKIFAKRFLELRLEQNLSQEKLAKVFSVGQQTISKWEHDISEPDYNTLVAIAKFFDVTTDYLLGLTDY